MKKDMPLEGLRWSRDSGSALYDTPPNGRSRTGWGGSPLIKLNRDKIVIVSSIYKYVWLKNDMWSLQLKCF